MSDNDIWREAIVEMAAPVRLPVGDARTGNGSLEYPKFSVGDPGLISRESDLEDPSDDLDWSLVFTEKDIITGSKLQFPGVCSNLQGRGRQ